MPLSRRDQLAEIVWRLVMQENHLFWGGVPFAPDKFSSSNQLVVGTPGSGKTLTFALVMLNQLPRPRGQASFGPRSDNRVYQSVVYDAKSEQVARLMAHGFTPHVDLYVLNPLDMSAMVWDMATDIHDHLQATELAKMLVAGVTKPQNYSGNAEHFEETAKSVVLDVIQVLQRTSRWRLRDLMNCFATPERIIAVLDLHPEGGTSRKHLQGKQEGASVHSTIERHLRKLRIVAACWDAIEQQHGPARLLSLDQWVRHGEGTVLVLPDGDCFPEITNPFNRFAMKRLDARFLHPSQRRRGIRRTLFFDELPTAGRIDVLPHLLNKGRDYGVTVTLGLQDVSQMYEEYGSDTTGVVLNACQYRALMKCSGSMAEWCSNQLGKQYLEYIAPGYSYGESDGVGNNQALRDNTRVWLQSNNSNTSRSQNLTTQRTERPAFTTADFLQMPDIKSTGYIPGIYQAPNGRVWRRNLLLSGVLKGLLKDTFLRESQFQEAAEPVEPQPNEQILRPMTAADCKRLQMPLSILEPETTATLRQRPTGQTRSRRTRKPPPF